DWRVDVWDLNGEPKRVFSVPTLPNTQFAVSAAGDALAVWSAADQAFATVTVWDITGAQPKARDPIKVPGSGGGGLAFARGGRGRGGGGLPCAGGGGELFGAAAGRLEVWGLDAPPFRRLRERPSPYTVIRAAADGKRIVAGGPGSLSLLNGETLRALVDGSEGPVTRSEEHTSELQSLTNLVCPLLLS